MLKFDRNTNPTGLVVGWSSVIQHLHSRVNDNERSRSQYWDIESAKYAINPDGTMSGKNSMGTVSSKLSPFYKIAHWILLIPFRMMGWRHKKFRQHLQNGYAIARKHARLLTHDALRQVLVISLIDNFMPLAKREGCNLVIGDGYGFLTSLFLIASPNRKTITCNLNKSLLLDVLQIRKSSPNLKPALVNTSEAMLTALADEGINLIAVTADNAKIIKKAPVSIATNVHSMMEMDPDIIANYFDILRDNTAQQTVFYCANRLYKKLQDGTITRFMKYPWDDEDKILHDSISYWSQWNVNKVPPFLHYRFGENRVIWHRLVKLKMNHQ